MRGRTGPSNCAVPAEVVLFQSIIQRIAAAAAVLALAGVPAHADIDRPLAERLSPDVVGAVFPDAEAVDAPAGHPAVAAVRDGTAVSGYLFSTHDLVAARGYGGEPFDIIVGLNRAGRITGTYLRAHKEPIIGPRLIPEARLAGYLSRLRNLDITRPLRRSGRGVDGVSGATISAVLMHSAVITSARRVAQLNGMVQAAGPGDLALDMDGFEPATWPELLAAHGVARLTLDRRADGTVVERPDGDDADAAPFSDLHLALVTPAALGRNLLGDKWHGFHLAQLDIGEQIILIAGNGRYRWKERRSTRGGIDRQAASSRIRVAQDDRIIPLGAERRLPNTAIRAIAAPSFQAHALYRLPAKPDFDPLRPWRLQLLVDDDTGETALFELPYRVPRDLVLGDDLALETAGLKVPEPAFFGLTTISRLNDWQRVWAARTTDITILTGLLIVVTSIFLFEVPLTRRRRLYRVVRLGVLAFVIIWLGWITNSQLTIINVLTYFQAAFGNLDWRLFLLDPLIFLLGVYTLAALILLGRGVFCGWLCPFGALQELLAHLARWVRLPAVRISETLQTRLWMVKYAVLLALIAIAGFSMEAAATAAEVEPFKTAIVLKFQRHWPYVLYAGLLLAAGLFVERFFCRFLCPLGGALALFGRFRMLNWLQRRSECGNPCHLCEVSCPVGAIARSGEINMNECLQCLDCQVEYHDANRCPPLVARRNRRTALADV